MFSKKLISCLLAATFFWCSCTTQKVALDPIRITANAGADVYQGSYPKITDIIHTKLELKFNWDSAFVIGIADIEAKPYFYPLNKVVLDATGFKINEVDLIENDDNYSPLKYSYNGKKLTVNLNKTYTRDQKFELHIDYVAMPDKLKVGKDIQSEDLRGIYFINRNGESKDKPQEIWTQGETEANSTWFPTINDPQEKMTQEISLTVPNRMITLSNGLLDFSSDNADGTRIDTWRQEQPSSTYLTMIAIGDFDVIKDHWRDKEVSYYMEPAYSKNARLIFGKTPEMIEFFSTKLGVGFPWDKYSQIVVRDFPAGAMENTTATVLFERMNMSEGDYLDENYEDIISHELFHHWFGDYVTCESWANLPLNESFATYGEYLWNEYKYGRDYADFKSMLDREQYFSNPQNKELNLIRFYYSNREKMFDDVSYQKGGQVLNMLRGIVGDDAFFRSLKLYLTKNSYKTVEIHDLRLAFEEVTGQDLNWFFNEWFLAAGNPVLNISTTYDNAGKQAVITIGQEQDSTKMPLYTLPMNIDIYAGGKVIRQKVTLNKKSQSFTFPVSAKPDLINVDPGKTVLAERIEWKPLQEWIFQYENAPSFMDRYEAITKLESFDGNDTARQEIMKALNDKNWYLRQRALKFISKLNDPEKNQVYNKVKDMALNDERSLVRAAAVTVLKKFFAGRDNQQTFEKTALDKATSVQEATAGNIN